MPSCYDTLIAIFSVSWTYGLVFGINLETFSVIIVSNISSVLFSIWYSHYVYVTPFVDVP